VEQEPVTEPEIAVPVHEYHERHIHEVTYVHSTTVEEPEVQSEVGKQKPEVAHKPASTSERKPVQKPTDRVEKATGPVQKATGKGKIKKLKEYDGLLGRKHTEEQIEEILDVYLQTGLLPTYVTQKMRWLYKHHRRLPERRELLEQAGKHIVIPETGGDANNVIPLGRTNVHNQKRTS
jgi:hypothetical protein